MKKQAPVIDHHAYIEKTQALYESMPTSARCYRPYLEMIVRILCYAVALIVLLLPFNFLAGFIIFLTEQSYVPRLIKAMGTLSIVLIVFVFIKDNRPNPLKNSLKFLDRKIAAIQNRYRLPFSRIFNSKPKNLSQEFLAQPYALRAMIQPQTRKRIQHLLEDPRQFGHHEILFLHDIFEKEKVLHQQFKDYFNTCTTDHPEYLQMEALNRQLQSWENQGTLKDHQSMPYLVEQWECLQQEHAAFQQQQQLEQATVLCHTNPVLRRL